MSLETKTVLITIKTYPNPSKKHGETVCCAGIDVNKNCWVRLFPITFRDLDQSRKFKKYNIIKVRCQKANDRRVESYKVDTDSIEIVDYLDTKKDRWRRRKDIVLPLVSPSFCHILDDIKQNKSLGLFKPTDIDFCYSKATVEKEQKRKACYVQLGFFDKRKDTIEQIPFDFYYCFKCHKENNCPGHKLLIIDWELGQAYRDWRHRYKKQDLLFQKIRQRWLELMCSKKEMCIFMLGI